MEELIKAIKVLAGTQIQQQKVSAETQQKTQQFLQEELIAIRKEQLEILKVMGCPRGVMVKAES